MAIRLRMSAYRKLDPRKDPLGRPWVGYYPRMSEADAWESGCGAWKISPERVDREQFALVVAEGLVRAIAEITGRQETRDGKRVVLLGRLLGTGHPVYDARILKPDPVETGSQNPVGYCILPEEAPFLMRECACGCGDQAGQSRSGFLKGHDVRAFQVRVREHFSGDSAAFFTWLDGQLASRRAGTGT